MGYVMLHLISLGNFESFFFETVGLNLECVIHHNILEEVGYFGNIRQRNSFLDDERGQWRSIEVIEGRD